MCAWTSRTTAVSPESCSPSMSDVASPTPPQLTPVNYAYQDGRILISTTRDRAKYLNVRRNPLVSLCVVRAGGRPYVSVFGRASIEERDIEGGTAEIARRMSGRPLPENFGELLRQQRRVLIIVTPERFVP